MRSCSHLLPDPGGEVVRECLDEIERLRSVLSSVELATQVASDVRDVVRASIPLGKACEIEIADLVPSVRRTLALAAE